jgi:cytochrome P450
MKALTDHPDQRELWRADLDGVSPTAVEEIVRWATPVINFRRTAARDTVVGGQEVKAGQKVVMFYNSANRDERQFPDAYRFDVTRDPNEHVGFGAGGPHFCLGANLARREIRVMFEELLLRSRASPTCSRATSSTASSACRARGARSAHSDARVGRRRRGVPRSAHRVPRRARAARTPGSRLRLSG